MIWATCLIRLLALAASLPLSEASPIVREVWAPQVRYPHEGVIWIIGQHHNVTWDTNGQQVTDSMGDIYLRTNGSTQTEHLLAQNVNFENNTRTVVQVPDVTPGVCQIVLFFDSGSSASDPFTISA